MDVFKQQHQSKPSEDFEHCLQLIQQLLYQLTHELNFEHANPLPRIRNPDLFKIMRSDLDLMFI